MLIKQFLKSTPIVSAINRGTICLLTIVFRLENKSGDGNNLAIQDISTSSSSSSTEVVEINLIGRNGWSALTLTCRSE